jgi:FAD-dependent oxidoreductase domain-containing protein 1
MKAKELGVHFIEGEIHNVAHQINNDKIWEHTIDDEMEDESRRVNNYIREVHVHLPDGDVFPFHGAWFVVTAGAESGHIGHLCGLGLGDDFRKVPIPVEPRKRYVYNVHCPTGPGLDCPLVVDPSGAYFRREGWGNNYLCGMSPVGPNFEEPDISNDDVDYDFFDEQVWPVIANRANCFENLKVKPKINCVPFAKTITLAKRPPARKFA